MAKSRVKKSLKPRRIFSDQLKKKIIRDIDEGKTNVTGAGREYQVSNVAIYRWLKKYSAHLHPSTTIVIQMDSEQYRSRELEKKIVELESVIGRKQMEIDYRKLKRAIRGFYYSNINEMKSALESIPTQGFKKFGQLRSYL